MALQKRTLWKLGIFIVMITPMYVLISQWYLLLNNEPAPALGANPIQATVLQTGELAIRALVIALAVSPLATLLRKPQILTVRRMLGLFAFFYATLHGLSYIGMDQLFSLKTLWVDLIKRWPISLGMLGWLLLLPLAITSTQAMVKKLGAKTWKQLHRGVFAVAVVAAAHNILIVKGLQVEPLVYAAILALLLIYRLLGRPRLPKRAAA
ncbi:MAG: ferric reductase-like transmembrane domain-containing protein [Pseudomonadota bacterium]